MRVVFVNPPISPFRKIMRTFDCGTESKGNYLYQPYDFLLLSARLPSEWPLELVDAIAERLDREDALRRLAELRPEILVLAMADTNWSQDLEFLGIVRRSFPEGILLACGDSFQELEASTSVESHCDGVIDDPLTIDFEEIAKAGRELGARREFGIKPWPKNDSSPRKALKRPTRVPIGLPRHEAFLSSRYRWPFARHRLYTTVFTAWGCPYSCSYCIMSKFPNLWRPSEEVLAEMAHVRGLGVREIYIGDRSFGLPRANVLEILKGMVERKLGLSWSAYFHPNQYDPELLEWMARSGCHTLIVGIESANRETLASFGRHVRERSLQRLLSHAKRLKIDICGDFIIGLPGESAEDVRRTVALSRKLGLQYASFNVAAPLPGSSIRAHAASRGAHPQDLYHFDSLGSGRILGNEAMDGRTIRNLKNQAVRGFYLRPGYLVGRLFRIKSAWHFLIQLQEAVALLCKAIPGFAPRGPGNSSSSSTSSILTIAR